MSALPYTKDPAVAIVPDVRTIILNSWPRIATPDDGRLYPIAVVIQTIKNDVVRGKRDMVSPKIFQKTGRKMLREIESYKAILEERFSDDIKAYYSKEFAALGNAEREIASLISVFNPDKKRPALFLRDAIIKMWSFTNPDLVMGHGTDSPLCKAVTAALGLAGLNEVQRL